MRLRLTVLACALAACAFTAIPGVAAAAPQHNRGLSIHAVPRQIVAGEAVLIYGQLKGSDHGNQLIRLYHRVNPAPFFSLIGTTRTNPTGQYEFTRAEGIVLSNRRWFVRGPADTHSRTVSERVAAEVSIASVPSAVNGTVSETTRHPIVFSGHVVPDHTGGRVLLQTEKGTANSWTTLKAGRIGPGSNYQISFAWRTPGERDVRVVFPGDRRNTAGTSDSLGIQIQQTQVPGFSIQSSDPVVVNGQSATISGVLDKPGTTTPETSTSVSLFAHAPGNGPYHLVQTATTDPTTGSYSFTVQSDTNELYQVRTTFAPIRSSAALFQGVQDVVSMSASSPTSTVNGHVTFQGNVQPDKAGHVIYLEKLGQDDQWHVVEVSYVNANSNYQFGWTFGTAGTKQFRARITGGPVNVGAASAPVTVDVSQPALSALPTS
jgi:hypothetical protein